MATPTSGYSNLSELSSTTSSPNVHHGGKPNLYRKVYLIKFWIYPRMRHSKKGLNDVLNHKKYEMIWNGLKWNDLKWHDISQNDTKETSTRLVKALKKSTVSWIVQAGWLWLHRSSIWLQFYQFLMGFNTITPSSLPNSTVQNPLSPKNIETIYISLSSCQLSSWTILQ